MAQVNFDQMWDRNFQMAEESELEKDTPFDRKLKITWSDYIYLERQRVSAMILLHNKSRYVLNALQWIDTKDAPFHSIATIELTESDIDTDSANIDGSTHISKSAFVQNIVEKPVTIYVNYRPSLIFDPNASTQPKILLIDGPMISVEYSSLIFDFLLNHFRPHKCIGLDWFERGNYLQNNCDLLLPLIRKIHTSNRQKQSLSSSSTEAMSEDSKMEPTIESKTDDADNDCNALLSEIPFLETGNLVTSAAAQFLQLCELNGTDGVLYVSISDLDYFGETLTQFASVILDECAFLRQYCNATTASIAVTNKEMDTAKLKKSVTKKCCQYALKHGYLLTGRSMFS